MKKRVLFLMLSMVFSLLSMAGDVTPAQALQQAQNFMQNHVPSPGAPRRAPGKVPQMKLAAQVNGLYLFNVSDGGFVIVSNDDRTRPILGFSDISSIDPNNMPDNMRAWLQVYADEIAWLQKQGSTVNTSFLKAPKKVTTAKSDIEPLVTARWNQDAPYNNLCPKYNGSSRSATGCVATAMAQVMYFHKWPVNATTTIPGYTTDSYGLTLDPLDPVVFDWDNMQDTYTSSTTGAPATAVATLMQYCGWSVLMDYGPSSGSNTDLVAAALKAYYDYNPTTQFVSRSFYTYDKWMELIYHELANNRPVVYGGMSTGGGHEFVCDGYKYTSGTDFFHINWGWGGQSDDYFVLSALDPDEQGIGGSSSNDGFHYGQDAVIGIQKSTENGQIANITPNVLNLQLNSMTLSQDYVTNSTQVTITMSITNNSNDDYDGDIYLGLKYQGDWVPLDGNNYSIPSGSTVNCSFEFKPSSYDLNESAYEFTLFLPTATGGYVTDGVTDATLHIVATNDKVPVYGLWTDDLSRSQFIIPADRLEDMAWGTVNGVTFNSSSGSMSWDSAVFDVYLYEVDQTTFANTTLLDWSLMNKVYSGSLSITNNAMTINFTTPYLYQGGNLLVGINQTVTGSYASCTWLGETIEGVSLGGYDSSISQQSFLPQTIFDFTPGEQPAVLTPRNLAVDYTSGKTATVTWTSNEEAFDIEVNGTVTEDVTNPYTLTGLDYATTYEVRVRAKNSTGVSEWTYPVTFTTELCAPEDMCAIYIELTDSYGDGWDDNYIKVVDHLTGKVLGRVTIDDGSSYSTSLAVPDGRDIDFVWVKGNWPDECSWTIKDVYNDVINSGSGSTSMSDGEVFFTYTVDCFAAPNNLTADLVADGATITWDGDGDSFNVQCRIAADEKTLFSDDFENGLDENGWTIYTEGEAPQDDGWYILNSGASNLSIPAHSGSYVVSAWSWSNNEYDADNWLVTPQLTLGNKISFWVNVNQGYPDPYEVKLSTTGKAIDDFTVTLKELSSESTNNLWQEVVLDISEEYAGQTGYIAIHHKCKDYNYLLIDDFKLIDFKSPAGEWQDLGPVNENTATLSGLDTDNVYEYRVQSVKDESTSDWSPSAKFALTTLKNNADNTELIENSENVQSHVTLANRTLYKDNSWNTLCLPFDVDLTADGNALSGAIARTLTGATVTDQTLNLVFGETVDVLQAGVPYIIKWTDGQHLAAPQFANVLTKANVQPVSMDDVDFIGIYAPKSVTDAEGDNTMLYFGDDNKLYWPNAPWSLGAQRAYFQLKNGYHLVREAGGANAISAMCIDFGDGTTGILHITPNATATTDDYWYSTDGIRHEGLPATKGVYINKGKKYVVK